MEHDAADHLHIEMPHAEHPLRRFAHRGESFGQDIVERLALGQLRAELAGLGAQFVVGQGFKRGLEGCDLADDLVEGFYIPVVGRAENGLGDSAEHG